MKRLTLILAAWALCGAAVMADEAGQIRRQFVEYKVGQSSGDRSVAKLLRAQQADGTWPDVDYASQRRGAWPTRDHLKRVEKMAVAYRDPESDFHRQPELRDAVLAGLRHWLDADYRNANWWNGRIGVPMSVCSIMILLGDELPADCKERAVPILARSEMGMTGQNKVWCAGIALMKGLLYGDAGLMDEAAGQIHSELRVSTEEGIQPDWSFHQHGPQQQFGNYGRSFAGEMIMWGIILRGTDVALRGDKLEVLRNYMLEGPSWIVWNGRMDLSGCGRQLDSGSPQSNGREIERQLLAMRRIDPEFGRRYEAVSGRVGFKPFWRSAMAVQRRPDWYASVRMSSTRAIGAETCNTENMQGLHLGDGVLLTYLKGGEYEDITPLWDWKRLPGTTCDQGVEKLEPKGSGKGYGGSDFAGVVGDGETGVAAMIYQRGGLSARKAWFFGKESVVCLGAGIGGTTKGPVYTSVEQSWLDGRVVDGGSWIQHAGVSYHFIEGTPVLKAGPVKGNWATAFPTRGSRPAAGDVFSLWIDHGTSPSGQAYAYVMIPQCEAAEMPGRFEAQGLEILSNTDALQAVRTPSGVQAVFYAPGKLSLGHGRVLAADTPCLVMLADGKLTLADPTATYSSVTLGVNGQQLELEFPRGADAGKPLRVALPES
ncbi:MAG: polysaccharide lyase family 8 super-sandwich domain-containing protein [Verrucomicrobiota bacterium JB025]|nr:polysaccharide lyase family 8 super-sandwich domain-containing protein [Verrucomicrobiota bacterium JB025]